MADCWAQRLVRFTVARVWSGWRLSVLEAKTRRMCLKKEDGKEQGQFNLWRKCLLRILHAGGKDPELVQLLSLLDGVSPSIAAQRSED